MSIRAGRSDERGRRFPIPMRGNECEYLEAVTHGEIRFPIPMRGNEMQTSPEPYARPLVPDPHEG